MESDLVGWLAVLARFVHVLAAIMWIGNSLLFTWMELNLLKPRKGDDADLLGTLDMLHGGGVFHLEKKVLHPGRIPVPLHWFMWQSYTTWISGFVLLLTLYHTGGGALFLDPSKSSLPGWGAVLLSLGGLAVGWLIYDAIWRSPLKNLPKVTIPLCLALLLTAAWLYNLVFNGRAVFLQIGAMMGTMMSANVFFHIIRNQRKFMAALEAGQSHDVNLGKAAKFRSLHNHYMTFPVLFLMLSAHFPQLTSAEWNVPILGVLIVGLMFIKFLMNSRYTFSDWLPALGGTFLFGCAAIFVLLSLPGVMRPAAGDQLVGAGRKLFVSQGCGACHMQGSADLAPSLYGIIGTTATLADGQTLVIDDTYLHESIVDPAAKVVKGYASAMPAYGKTLTDEQIHHLVAYIRSLSR